MKKLLTAIKKTKSIGAAGPGNVPPSFLKSHGPFALQALLSISNSSCSNAHVSLILGVAIIKLLLGAGKSPSKVAFFYPCVIKLLERIHALFPFQSQSMCTTFQCFKSQSLFSSKFTSNFCSQNCL